ncbi:EcsC family protein [Azospirillum agricola]|uniref:EcsC family protein n=1 Tax=Azospirillum agricola TaxID=1720247 RepID=UPI000A0EF3C6|nr:EcsC family protein [Azospirillum agricola]SMH60195.1 EcsC protein family protein [Azospirillum lipoferum]
MPDPHEISRNTNSCAILEREDFEILVQAANEYIAARSTLMSFMSSLGSKIEAGIDMLPEGTKATLLDAIRGALEHAHRISTGYMDNEKGREASTGLYSLIGAATGAASGFFGLAATAAELPIATATIMRSIADIARSKGADLDDVGVQATCIEVFAYGGPLEDDDDADIAFVTSRLGATLGAAPISEMITKVAARYAIAISPKILAQSVPITGAVLGAALNWTYMRFYQSIASVLFTLRPVELRYDKDQVRSCFASIVREIEKEKFPRKKA